MLEENNQIQRIRTSRITPKSLRSPMIQKLSTTRNCLLSSGNITTQPSTERSNTNPPSFM
ncbi:hypothetical protein L3Y34_017748 [Caenorhabditis briggsae]|uniref:Uncharacterized protein n=1 Tax=Caenorhabditis briggsae TaxID=6238 RepID=A0AAE9DIC3_CAEBR|nr:hypothetical protein L3Y34_017748 [Caenorhabditis briggsae]